MTKKEFLYGLNILSLEYSDEIGKAKTELWWDFFKNFDAKDFLNTVKEHIKYSSFFPKISQLLRILTEQMKLTMNVEDAWSTVLKKANRYEAPCFDEITSKTIQSLGGISRICDSDVDSISYLKKMFCESYSRFKHVYEKEIIDKVINLPSLEQKELKLVEKH